MKSKLFALNMGCSGLAVVLVGDDPASQVYIRGKERACAEVGIRSERHELPAQASADEILELVRRLAARPSSRYPCSAAASPGYRSEPDHRRCSA